MNESDIQDYIRANAPTFGSILMRNNSGAFKDESGRLVRFGLNNDSKAVSSRIKSSDLIGFTTKVIAPEDVGKTFAIFTAIECKKKDWKPSPTDKREKAQRAFIDWVKAKGGIAGFANSWESFRAILGR
jgi:hypothetical protein